MKKIEKKFVKASNSVDGLFKRVVSILEQARGNVVRSVNNNMVAAYWLIGKEIVKEIQKGQERAEYGKGVIKGLSEKLTKHYGEGYASPTLWNFRQFYLTYQDRQPQILSPAGRESSDDKKLFLTGRELGKSSFHPNLSWSHYRALVRIESKNARDFYETEAVRCGWKKYELERQISTLFYERLLKSRDKRGMLKEAASKGGSLQPIDVTGCMKLRINPVKGISWQVPAH